MSYKWFLDMGLSLQVKLSSLGSELSCILKPFRFLINFMTRFWSNVLKNGDRIEEGGHKMVTGKIHILELYKGCCLETSLFRVPKGRTLELRTGVSLFGHKVTLYTEIPQNGKEYKRGEYNIVSWENPGGKDGAELYARFQLDTVGSFHFYFSLDDSNAEDGTGYILVEPELRLGDEILELDGIQCVTVLSKLLGPLSSWTDILTVAHNNGYNMIHFTPIQELGISNSAYSLRNQLKMNPIFGVKGKAPDVQQVKTIIDKIRKEWKMLSICDIVLNHTANESEWLQEHPECTYNLINCPHLRPAYLLDLVLHNFSLQVANGDYELLGVPAAVNKEDHLNAIRHLLLSKLIPESKIVETFSVNVVELVQQFQAKCQAGVTVEVPEPSQSLVIIQDPEYRKLQSTVDMDLALKLYNTYRNDCFDEDTRQRKCAEAFKTKLDELNAAVQVVLNNHIKSAVENCISTIRYFRLQNDGPKIALVTKKDPLVCRYFFDGDNGSEEMMYSDKAKYIMAHNGWVMDHDPLKNFAEAGSNIYLRRELIAWGDSVKLRFGEKVEDCPYLWEHMRKYVEMTAELFDGVRLDNCHSTPIHVAQYLLDAARKVRPNLYVVAELFTNSDTTDNIFVNKLGITSLIRECMSGWDSHEVGRLVYRYGGRPVGGFREWVFQGKRMVPGIAHALFLDMTHDNPSPVDKRTVYDLLPSTALVSMASCGSGSTMGYDQLVPHHIHVVDEDRNYMGQKDIEGGIGPAKLALNKLHSYLSNNGFDQVFVDQIDSDIVCVTRYKETTLDSFLLFSYTAFQWPNDYSSGQGKGITVSGSVDSVVLEAYLTHESGKRFVKPKGYSKSPKFVNGLKEYELKIRENIETSESEMLQVSDAGQGNVRISFTSNFMPGSVVAIRILSEDKSRSAVQKLVCGIEKVIGTVSTLNLSDLNYSLYTCSQEEESGSAYDIPGFGPFVYCGLQGIMSVLDEIAMKDDLGHPLCSNIRDGHWLAEYIVNRFEKRDSTKQLGVTLGEVLGYLKDMPPSMRPCYFHCVISQVHAALISQATSIMSSFVMEGSELVQMLALGSVQCSGVVASLPPLSANIEPPLPPSTSDGKQACVVLAAGLPHFSTGYMRSWGRDTFISLRGLFLLTGRYDEARYHILGYGGCLRHGLIPNLLDGGLNPRFNCRDAVWWWLYTIQSYTQIVPEGLKLLRDKVNRIFPTDDAPHTYIDQDLCDVMQEALKVHFQGLCFRERNAGTAIDEHMTSFGFDNQIGVHPITGFVFGGNEWNCGTWMDKMGSSAGAGTKGKPATPRDGADVEIVALSKSCVSWLAQIYSQGHYPYPGVTRTSSDGRETTWTWQDWADTIQSNFEKEFWLGDEAEGKLVNKRGIYKDTVGATQAWADYQLRPNFTIAMVVAPELFVPEHASQALNNVKKHLLGPLGMKTLDPSDWAYNGYYDNSNQSNDPKIAHGYNYHQGPEWLWPVGYYLRARLLFDPKVGKSKEGSVSEVRRVLSRMWAAIRSSPWRGLTELTNKDGAFCSGSSPTQAWSMATALEVLYDLRELEQKQT